MQVTFFPYNKIFSEYLDRFKSNLEKIIERYMASTEELIKQVARDVVLLLLEKNKAYGDTANNPPQIFSKLSAREGILARLDDKLSRVKNKGLNDNTEDTISDIIGYLILYKVQVLKEELIKKKDK